MTQLSTKSLIQGPSEVTARQIELNACMKLTFCQNQFKRSTLKLVGILNQSHNCVSQVRQEKCACDSL